MQSLRAMAGSSELAIVAAAAPPPRVVVATNSLVVARHIDLPAIIFPTPPGGFGF